MRMPRRIMEASVTVAGLGEVRWSQDAEEEEGVVVAMAVSWPWGESLTWRRGAEIGWVSPSWLGSAD